MKWYQAVMIDRRFKWYVNAPQCYIMLHCQSSLFYSYKLPEIVCCSVTVIRYLQNWVQCETEGRQYCGYVYVSADEYCCSYSNNSASTDQLMKYLNWVQCEMEGRQYCGYVCVSADGYCCSESNKSASTAQLMECLNSVQCEMEGRQYCGYVCVSVDVYCCS